MNERRWSTRIVVRYALFQIPAVALLVFLLILVRWWVDLPAWFFWGLIGLWVTKDVVLFPFTWHAYDRGRPENTNSMIGVQGIAEDRLAPSGYIRVRGELWQGEVMGGGPPIERGGRVVVRGIRKLTLLVRSDNEERTE